MPNVTIMWPLLLVGICVVCLSWIRMREKVPLYKRSKIEQIATLLLILFLLIDIGHAVFERKDLTDQANDCIRFYRYFPNFQNDSEFNFIKKGCYKIFSENEIGQLKASGIEYQRRSFNSNYINFSDQNFKINIVGD